MTETRLDPRLNVLRDDLADVRLKGQVEAARFVTGEAHRILVPVASLHRRPGASQPVDTQVLFGESVQVFERSPDGWAWVQSDVDGYVGWLEAAALGPVGDPPTHWVTAVTTFLYPEPDLRAVPASGLSMGARLTITDEAETRGTRYALLSDGRAVIAAHVAPLGRFATDYVSVAERFLEVPYLWAGRAGMGLDCSALVQLSMMMAGLSVLRDTDMQVDTIGTALAEGADGPLMRGDLVFWNGHVGIMRDDRELLHANGNTMTVASEPLVEAIERIERLYARPTGARRPPALSLRS
ncbi:MAG: NlpC/P60 family protein [Pseudomonadota bacterium]